MNVFVVPRLLAAKVLTYFRPRAVDHSASEQSSFWILHAR